MKSLEPGKLVWPGMVLAGLALAAVVLVSWPESTTRIVRLPDGEAMPKAPRELERAPQAVVKVVRAVPQPTAAPRARSAPRPSAEPEPVRVLAAVEPDPSPDAGPAPVPSELELRGDYDQESPEQLGAEPLPGSDPSSAELTPAPPPVAR